MSEAGTRLPTLADDAPVAALRRGGEIESVHRGRYAVVDPDGALVDSLGEVEGYVWMRSSAKPFQALPLVFSGAAEAFGFTDEEISVACASHGGEPRHLAAVRSILRRVGLSERDLQNGFHPPMHAPSAARLRKTGESPRAVHGNCSGKHAAMLAVCVQAGWDPAGYRDPDGPLEKLLLRTVSTVCGIGPEKVRLAGDGCGVPVFAVPLRGMALGFARLASGGEGFPEDLAGALRRVRDAMRSNPYMIAGTGRLDTKLMEGTGLVAKSGAEAVFGAASAEDRRWGMALKVSDGAGRALAPAATGALFRQGIPVPDGLLSSPVTDLRGGTVGEVSSLL